MKIAVVSEDGVSVSQHFGRAPLYVVVEVEGGQIVGNEKRSKVGHHVFASEDRQGPRREQHGYGAASHARHERMASSIADCEVVIAGGMGRGAFGSMQAQGIRPILTDVADIRQAALQCAQGTLPNLMDRLH
jgi:predicted Fe-Mo cluster-binding NifX family protein